MNSETFKDYFIKLGYPAHKLTALNKIQFLYNGAMGAIWKLAINNTSLREESEELQLGLLLQAAKRNQVEFKPDELIRWERIQKLKKQIHEKDKKISKAKQKIQENVDKAKNKKLLEFQLNEKTIDSKKQIIVLTQKKQEYEDLNSQYRSEIQFLEPRRPSSLSIEDKINSIFTSLNQIESKKATNGHANSSVNMSFNNVNGFENGLTHLKQQFTKLLSINFTPQELQNVLDNIQNMQKILINRLESLQNKATESNIFPSELEFNKLSAEFNKICLENAQRMNNLYDTGKKIDDHLESKELNEKQRLLMENYASNIGVEQVLKTSRNHLMQIQASNCNENCKRLQKRLENEKQNIKQNLKPVIEQFYDESSEVLRQSYEMAPKFKFSLKNIPETILTHETEFKSLKYYPAGYNYETFFNSGSLWNCLTTENDLKNSMVIIFNNPTTRPDAILWKLMEVNSSISTLSSMKRQLEEPPKKIEYPQNDFDKITQDVLDDGNIIRIRFMKIDSLLELCYEWQGYWLKPFWETAVNESRLFEGKNLKYYRNVFDKNKIQL